MEAHAMPETLASLDGRVKAIELARAAEAEATRLNEAATKGDIKELNDRFNGLIKAIWSVASILAVFGLGLLSQHL